MSASPHGTVPPSKGSPVASPRRSRRPLTPRRDPGSPRLNFPPCDALSVAVSDTPREARTKVDQS